MPNPNYAVTSSEDGTVRIWDLDKASTLQVLFLINQYLGFSF